MNLLIATHNPAKIKEFKFFLQVLEKKGIQLLTLKDINIQEEPEENGSTIEENAEIKARYYAEKSGFAVLADDGGFFIDALNGAPGVKSNRWLGYKASDEELIEHTLKMMKNIPEGKRQAHLKLCLCYFNPQTGVFKKTQAAVEGRVAEVATPEKLEGFPFRALHIVLPFQKYYDTLTEKEHEQVNHRGIAVRQIILEITEDLCK